MPITNLALNLTELEQQDKFYNISIGNSKFGDDVWDLSPLIPEVTTSFTYKRISFSFIHNDEMKYTVKQYAYYKLGKIKPQTVVYYITSKLPSFVLYCENNHIDLITITQDDFLKFNLWLKSERKVSLSTGHVIAHIVEEIINVGKIKGWNVTQDNIFLGVSSHNLWNTKRSLKANKTKPIPSDIFDKILYHALYDEKDIIVKAGIIIQSQTGLRINEVLSIQEGCVKTNQDGSSYLEVWLRKTEKGEPVLHKLFINELVKNAIFELEDFTRVLRSKSGFKELFLVSSCGYKSPTKIRVVDTASWSRYRLKKFVKKWNILDLNGNLYPLNSHQFRATFVREMIKQKIPIAMIMKQFAHVSIEMTAHYLTLQEDEIKEIYSEMIFSPESKIAGLRAKEIKGTLNNLFHGKTREEIHDVISNLTNTTSFNPLPTGVCLYDFRRGNCTDGDGCFMYNCPNYITEVQFYPILKKELELLEAEMTRLKGLGRERQWQCEYIKYKHLKPLVNELEVQLDENKSIR